MRRFRAWLSTKEDRKAEWQKKNPIVICGRLEIGMSLGEARALCAELGNAIADYEIELEAENDES